MGRGRPWEVTGGAPKARVSVASAGWGVVTAVMRAKRTRTSHMGGRVPVRDFFGGHSAEDRIPRAAHQKNSTYEAFYPPCKVRVDCVTARK